MGILRQVRPQAIRPTASAIGLRAVQAASIAPQSTFIAARYSSTASNVGTNNGSDVSTGASSGGVHGSGIHRTVVVDRELPDPFKDKWKNTKYAVAYGLGVIVSCVIIFNYEKTTSPIINSVFYFLRRSPKVIEALGEDVKYANNWPWILGELNTVKGNIDISFQIKGEKRDGTLYFKANRESKLVPFSIDHWYLKIGDEIVDLKEFDQLNF